MAALSLSALLVLGCAESGSDLAPVRGRVTLDGQPLAGARLRFQPETAGGSPSYGTTDQQGSYELGFKRGQPGAQIGWHVIRIESGSEAGESGKKGSARTLPARYNAQSELRREVKSDEENTIDFELESDPA
jgi:hypothetical protein